MNQDIKKNLIMIIIKNKIIIIKNNNKVKQIFHINKINFKMIKCKTDMFPNKIIIKISTLQLKY